MAAAVSSSNPSRSKSTGWFGCSGTMFRPTTTTLRGVTWLLVTACALFGGGSRAEEENLMEEFLKREYTLAKPYRGIGFSSTSQWDLMGTTMMTPDHVRLTPDMPSRQGAVWSRMPCFLWDWELRVHFKIHGQGKKNLNGDGMAVWLTKERMQSGPVFGNINKFTGLAVFIDTYPNSAKKHDRAFPYISVMLGNGTLTYDHERDGRPSELGGCAINVRNNMHDTFFLLRYIKNQLTLLVDVDGKQEWKDCADITSLSLPIGYFFGASSATGDLSDNHDIISMKVYQLETTRTPEEEKEVYTRRIPQVDMTQFEVEVEEEGRSSIHLFFIFLFSVMGLCVLVVVGLMVYSRWKENRRKRFY